MQAQNLWIEHGRMFSVLGNEKKITNQTSFFRWK
jgi:hypothetical protein